jgi:hypothetical protein
VTEHVEVSVVTPFWAKVQVFDGENAPEPFVLNVTVPVGLDFEPDAVSVTSTVQVDGAFTGTVDGEQPVTEVNVERLCTLSLNDPLLEACRALEASSKVPVMLCAPAFAVGR